MIYLIATDFYTYFELIETNSKEEAINYIKTQDTDGINIIGSSDDITQEEAENQADEVLFVSDYMED